MPDSQQVWTVAEWERLERENAAMRLDLSRILDVARSELADLEADLGTATLSPEAESQRRDAAVTLRYIIALPSSSL